LLRAGVAAAPPASWGGSYVGIVDNARVIAFPRDQFATVDAAEAALIEIDAAIAMVAGGHARRVRLTALPFVDRVAGIGAAHSRAAGVAFRLEGAERAGVVTVTVGPRE
jgi:hypothetical protein